MSILSEQNRKALLLTLHQDIQDHARRTAKAALNGQAEGLCYPPNVALRPEEVAALKRLREIPAIQPTLEKFIADAAASVIFGLFNYIDGTGDPAISASQWTGVALVDHGPAHDGKEFLHDAFFESYWEWHDAR